MIVFLLSSTISKRVVTLVLYTILGGVLFLAYARTVSFLNSEDKTFLEHMLPGKIGVDYWLPMKHWVSR